MAAFEEHSVVPELPRQGRRPDHPVGGEALLRAGGFQHRARLVVRNLRLQHPRPTDQDRETGRTLLAEASSAPLRVAIAPGASQSPRRWPAERFLQVVDEILTQRDVRFMLVGGDDVRPVVDAISPVENEKILDLVGLTTVGSLGVVLSGVDLLIVPAPRKKAKAAAERPSPKSAAKPLYAEVPGATGRYAGV